jgi:hypothetical protein
MDYDSVLLRDERAALANNKQAIARIVNYERRLRNAIKTYIAGGAEPLELIDLEEAMSYEEGFDPERDE